MKVKASYELHKIRNRSFSIPSSSALLMLSSNHAWMMTMTLGGISLPLLLGIQNRHIMVNLFT